MPNGYLVWLDLQARLAAGHTPYRSCYRLLKLNGIALFVIMEYEHPKRFLKVMSRIELRPTQMHWTENVDPFKDCCVTGGIYLKIGEVLVSDGSDIDWSVSTAAFNFLRTLFEGQPLIGREALIPHCGFTMWPIASEPDGLYMPNCDIGINWSITRDADQVVHEFKDGTKVRTEISEWNSGVCRFADEVLDFLHTAWPKVIDDEQDRQGFEMFLSLWQKRRAEAEFENDHRAND